MPVPVPPTTFEKVAELLTVSVAVAVPEGKLAGPEKRQGRGAAAGEGGAAQGHRAARDDHRVGERHRRARDQRPVGQRQRTRIPGNVLLLMTTVTGEVLLSVVPPR